MEEGSRTKKMIRFPSVSSSDEESDDNTRFGMLIDIDLLNCPICVEGFTGPIFQCDNGHLACSSCCSKLRNKCSSCCLPIGNIRCRAVEKMIESIVYRCPNFKHGCKENLCSENHKIHEQKCVFGLQWSCPLSNCDYKGRYKDLFQHFDATHKNERWFGRNLYNKPFRFGESFVISMHIRERMCVLMETNDSLLFVVHCFEKRDSVCVSVECIAPLREFSCSISFGYGEVKLKSELLKTKKGKEVIFENPKVVFMFSSYFMENGRFEFKIVINKNM